MGYACPVCAAPQADGEHLANHLAFTALIHGGDHESWLDDHVPDWADRDPAGLAPAVAAAAEPVDVDGEANPTGGVDGATAPASDRPLGDVTSGGNRGRGAAPDDPATRRILEAARELTRQRRAARDDEE